MRRLFIAICILTSLALCGCSSNESHIDGVKVVTKIEPTLKYHKYYKLVIKIYSDYDCNVVITDTIYSSKGKSEVVIDFVRDRNRKEYRYYQLRSIIDHEEIYQSHSHQKIEIVLQTPISKEEFDKI